jgi:5-methylcytosine-specific restriction endonuclease McrA
MRKKKKVVQPVYKRLGTVEVDAILDIIPLEKNSDLPRKKEFFGEHVKLTSPRYLVYATKGTTCAHCGITGTFFAIEQSLAQNTKKFHLNLYAIDKKTGEEVMLTVDHIVPKAKGGPDRLENKQPLCFRCNNKKGDKLLQSEL